MQYAKELVFNLTDGRDEDSYRGVRWSDTRLRRITMIGSKRVWVCSHVNNPKSKGWGPSFSKSGDLRMQRAAQILKIFGKEVGERKKTGFYFISAKPQCPKTCIVSGGLARVARAMCLIWENWETVPQVVYSNSLAAECFHNCAGKVALASCLQMRKVKLMEGLDLLRVTAVE